MRPVWFLAGVGAGVYVVVRARRVVESLTPEGISDRVAGLQLGWQLFTDEVRTESKEKETELRERLLSGLPGPKAPAALPAGSDDETRAAERGGDHDGHQ